MSRPDPPVTYSQTVPCALVHRAAIAEVLPTSAVRAGTHAYHIGVQIPRQHPFYGDTLAWPERYDPMLLLEACRQAFFILAHRFYGVPFGRRFILRQAGFEVYHDAALTVRDRPTNALLRCQVTNQYAGADGLTGLRTSTTVEIDDCAAMAVSTSISWVPGPQWSRMRADFRAGLGLPAESVPDTPPARIAPGRVDRRDPRNTVISALRPGPAGSQVAALCVDTGHPTLFDHPVDHVPGMLQYEAFRQLAIAAGTGAEPGAPPARLAALSGRFSRFAELDLPAQCRTVAEPVECGTAYRCSLWQAGQVLSEADIRLVPTEGPSSVDEPVLSMPGSRR